MKCPRCGGQLERKDDGIYFCPNCKSKFVAKPAATQANAQAVSNGNERYKSTVAGGYSPKVQNPQNANGDYFAQRSSQTYSGSNYGQPATYAYDQNNYPTAPIAPAENPPADADQIPSAAQIRASARPLVKKNRGYCVLTEILLRLVQIGSLIPLLLFGPLLVGGAIQSSFAGFYVDVANDKCEGSHSTYRGFNNFMPALRLNLLCALMKLAPIIAIVVIVLICVRYVGMSMNSYIYIIVIIICLAICLIILWIHLSTISQYAFFGLNSGVSTKATELIKHASKLIDKSFGKILVLKLSFIGWWLLCYFTWGLMMFYVVPYYKTALAKQYLALLAAKNSTPAEA